MKKVKKIPLPSHLRDDTKYGETKKELYIADKSKREEIWKKLLAHKELDVTTAKQHLARVPDKYRPQLWTMLLQIPEDSEDRYQRLLRTISDNPAEPTLPVVDEFTFSSLAHSSFSFSSHCLTPEGQTAAKRLVWITKRNYPEKFHQCRAIVDIICLLLLFLTEDKVYSAIENFLADPKFHTFAAFEKYELLVPAFLILLKKRFPKLGALVDSLNVNPTAAFNVWFSRLFIGSLPYQTVLSIFDLYLWEGAEVPFRVAVSLFRLFEEELLKCTTATEFLDSLKNLLENADNNDLQLLFEAINGFELGDDLMSAFSRARLATFPSFQDLSVIANEDQFADLWAWLPSRLIFSEPKLLFRTGVNGFNLHLVTNKCHKVPESILLIKSKTQAIFGVFISVPWEKSTSYRGTGEMFLFSLSPVTKKYSWSRLNDLFMMVSDKSIQFGGGSGVGLWLDDELDKGYSQACETFESEPLNGEKDFRVVQVEVFGFKS